METQPNVQPLRYGCDDIWTWNRKDRSPEIRLYGTNLQTVFFHPHWSSGTAGVRGTKPINNGRHFWEIQISRRVFGTSMMFGIATRKAPIHADSFMDLIGEDEHGWGLSHKGLLCHSGKKILYTKHFREDFQTVIGIYFDGIAGTLTYYKDGKCLGVAFRGLNEIKEPLYPMVCSTAAKTEMILQSMRREYTNLQDRCRAVIIKYIKSKKDLKHLCIPPKIRNYLSEEIFDHSKKSLSMFVP